MSINYDKHSIEKRHNQRFLGIFLMFVVVAVVVGLFAAMSITGYNIFTDIFGAAPAPAPVDVTSGGSGGLVALENVTNCTDTDGGANIYVKGIAKSFIARNTTGCVYSNGVWTCTDFCLNTKWIKEFYCIQNKECSYIEEDCNWNNVNGTLSCYNGACQESGGGGNSSNGTNGTQPGGPVTYQGVLNMLNKCRLTVTFDSGATCNMECSDQHLGTCTEAYAVNSVGHTTLRYECGWKLGLGNSSSLTCNCCSTPK